jgi:tetratricopeptide (TPR) repeat protein
MEAYKNSDFRQAADFLTSAAKNDFITAKLTGMTGDSYMQIGQSEKSDSVFASGLEMYPDDAELRVIRAFSLIQRSVRLTEARKLLEKAMELNPSDEIRRMAEVLLSRLSAIGQQ